MEHKTPTISDNEVPRLERRAVLQVIPALETGGAERTTLEVARAIVAAGGQSMVISAGGGMVAQLEAEGSTHITLPVQTKNPLKIWRHRTAMIDLIAQHQISLVHARSRAPAWSAFWAARAANVPFVTTYHGIYNAKTSPKRLYNSVMARGDRVIANSAYTASTVRDAYGEAAFFAPAKMVVIPRGADLARFDPGQMLNDRREAALEALGGRAAALRILLPGRLTAWKGQQILIDALAQLSTVDHLHVAMVGSAQGRDEYAEALQSSIDAHGLGRVVRLVGHWEDMPAAYDWADITLSTSTRPEAFGRVAVEAQAMGCPVIASSHGGALETVAPDQTGMLVPPGDPGALAEALMAFEGLSAARREEMSAAARARIIKNYSIETMTRATLSVYKSLGL